MHLAPVSYTEIWALDKMHSCAVDSLGATVADKYFKLQENATAYYNTYEDAEVSSLPARILFERFQQTKQVPSKRSFLQSSVADVVRMLYRDDHTLIERVLVPH
jgi:hypothetical protein